MRTVIYETHNAIFDFELPDVIGRLKYYSEQNVREATDLLETISSSLSEVIKITSDYFGYIVLNLLKDGKGSVFCKFCQKTYQPIQLQSIPVGFGKSPFEVNIKEEGGIVKRIIKKLFSQKKPKIIGMRGGDAYACSEHHVLISMVTWVS
jgi:hypothetical protein